MGGVGAQGDTVSGRRDRGRPDGAETDGGFLAMVGEAKRPRWDLGLNLKFTLLGGAPTRTRTWNSSLGKRGYIPLTIGAGALHYIIKVLLNNPIFLDLLLGAPHVDGRRA